MLPFTRSIDVGPGAFFGHFGYEEEEDEAGLWALMAMGCGKSLSEGFERPDG
jgi:hypothetical protein